MLRPANGSPTQRWTFALVNSAQDDYDERWDLLQRVGRFLGQFWGFFRVVPLERDTFDKFVFCDYRDPLLSFYLQQIRRWKVVYSVTVIFQLKKNASVCTEILSSEFSILQL